MFSQPGPQPEDEAQEGTTGTEPPRSDAARVFDQVLTSLQPPGSSPAPDVEGVTAATTEHAATLRATRDAHQEAHEMLSVATAARNAAAEEAERIILEARDGAERARQELAGWAAAQRAKVDALAADMVESANRDADAIRAEALRTSMAEAEETARAYVAEAAERAQQDGEAIRAEARTVLNRATELSASAAEAIADLTAGVREVLERIEVTRSAMTQLLAENPASEPLAGLLDTDDLDAGDTDPDDLDGADIVVDDEALVGDAITDDPTDDPDADLYVEEDADDATAASAPAPLERTDRQLGSMFRRHGQRGE